MVKGRRVLWLVGIAALASSTHSGAQTAKPAPAPGPKFAIPGSPDSASPGGRGGPANAGAKGAKGKGRGKSSQRARPDASVATFPGFRLLSDGSSRIYVELTKSVSVGERKANGALVYTLRNAQVLARNNKNALITTHFSTPVARARLVPAGNDVELVIDLRADVVASHQVVPGENGTARLEIDFPAGEYPLAPGLYQPPAGGRGPRNAPANDELPPETPQTTPPPAPSTTSNPAVGPPSP